MTEKKSRYLGVQPFQTSDQQLFFGRDEDIENLHDFILLEKMVVLFGKSGYGKSSLLNAGIVPRLLAPDQPESFRYKPVEVRFTDYAGPQAASPLQTLARLIGGLPTDPDGDFLSTAGAEDSLWLRLKRRQRSANGRFVLLFDQFEEFFSYPPAQQEAFRRQLAELLFTDIPQALRQKQDTLGDEARRYLATPMNVKAVFVIRSDRMSLLDSMKDTLPAILHKRYELRPLTTDQARDAIVKPARIPGDVFNSPPFEYTDDGLQAILEALGNSSHTDTETAGIEAFQLQIICEYLENRVRDGHVRDLDGNGLPDITREELPEMATLYEQYYHRKLGELKPEDREKARLVLENILLAEDSSTGESRRKSVDKIDLLNTGIKSELLDELEKTYLIRRERNTVGGYNYEISHDTLLAPVMRAKKERLEQEAAVQREKERLEALARAQQAEAAAAEERRKTEEAERLQKRAEENEQRARQRTVLAGIVAVLALLLAIYAYYQQNKAKEAQQKAAESARLASEQRDIARVEKLKADSSAVLAFEQKQLAEQKSREAEMNLDRARREELRALVALEQVKKEKNATEEQRRRAEENYRFAQEKTVEAERQAGVAREALEAVKSAISEVIRLNIRESDGMIKRLDYDGSEAKLRASANLTDRSEELSDALLELVFWYCETGELTLSMDLLLLADSLTVSSLPGGVSADRSVILSSIRQLDSMEYHRLELRYYPRMINIPGGTFDMGAPDSDTLSNDDERPVHRVTVSSFKLSATEVTWWQYHLFCVASGHEEAERPGWGGDGDNPVVNVTWYDAVEYANWLSDRRGLSVAYDKDEGTGGVKWEGTGGYRLPTEAEWEYAARGGNRSAGYLYAGSNNLDSVGWYYANSGSRTRAVGEKAPNELGLYDMSGNVWEWCWDWYGDYTSELQENPRGAEAGSYRVIRGGSWYDYPEYCRVADRGRCSPYYRNYGIGFRLVLVP